MSAEDGSKQAIIKTKVVATLGPASGSETMIGKLIDAGVDVFRLNFAHGKHDWLENVINIIRRVSAKKDRSIGLLGDLSGPKIRLEDVAGGEVCWIQGGTFEFVRTPAPNDPTKVTCTYEQLIDDLEVGDMVVLADGSVITTVVETRKPESIVCKVIQSGCVRNRQGVNLPGATLSTPSLTEKDRVDLEFACRVGLDYIGLSFVRRAEDIKELREAIEGFQPTHPPQIVAKIEKMEAVNDLDRILDVTDGVMVARGDLGVETDIARVPILQKHIIRQCNRRRIPVITATQMLESMISSDFPTRAESTDVCNAVLDGTDAVMLSGETAIGQNPPKVVSTMKRIAYEAEKVLSENPAEKPTLPGGRHGTMLATEGVTVGAVAAAQHIDADLVVVATHGGRTALAVSKQRGKFPIVAVTDNQETARRLALYWSVIPFVTDAVQHRQKELMELVTAWAKEKGLAKSGDRIVMVGSTDWGTNGHDLMLLNVVP
ncbi:pyruvate kinase [Calycomorphotria hydatis]|uniref:Pyruvate kinase n=1 Tax=Calycomorphotria hydatis TaxID=2528027 RepID=A0A517TBP1_9PLAN|nr:pyruvate kinase [Calycomorphotria hydatis]QDT65788.1 Pyruvate kinase [Calycomorphotria hydatis]